MFLPEHIPSDILRRWRFYPIRLLFDLFTLLAVEEECPRVLTSGPEPRSGDADQEWDLTQALRLI